MQDLPEPNRNAASPPHAEAISFSACRPQTAAVLEVVHAYLGFVRSPWMLTLLQVGRKIGDRSIY